MTEISRTAAPAVSPGYRTYALLLLTAVYTSNFLDRQIMSILLVPIQKEFGASDSVMGLLTGFTFAIFYATLGIPIAMMADRGNRKLIITVCLAIWSVMTVACGMAATLWQLFIARIGVAVGEAGGTPPSHSILSDLYKPEERATALGIFSLGVPLGAMLAFFGGAYIAEHYGWRMAFIVVGLPGLLLALLVWFTIDEPQRTVPVSKADQPSFGDVSRFIWQQQSLVHAVAGGTLVTLVGWAGLAFFPAFLVRVHGMALTEVGLYFALVAGIAGGLGTFAGGYLADLLAKRDIRWMPWVVGIAFGVSLPFTLAGILATDRTTALILLIVPFFVGSLYLPPTFALAQNLVTPRMRATTSGLVLFVFSLIGMGGGPTLAGVISTSLTPSFGAGEALRWALLACTLFNIWGVLHYWLAGRTLAADLARARAAS